MKILIIGSDPSLCDRSSSAFQRLRGYFPTEWHVDILLLSLGPTKIVDDGLGFRVIQPGGSVKVQVLLRAIREARRLVRKIGYDVVSVQDALWAGFVGALAACPILSTRSTPLHLQDHSAFFARGPFSFQERCLWPFSVWLVKRATRIRTVSEVCKRALVARGVSAAIIDVIPIFTKSPQASRVGSPAPPRVVFSAGRLENEKGYEALIHAWADPKFSHYTLVIAGDGSQRFILEQLTRTLGIADRVEWLGFQADLAPYWQRADVYIQPSFFEGWGMALFEAASCGLPIIAGKNALFGNFLTEGESVQGMEPGNVASIVRALSAVLENDDARLRLANAAHAQVARFVSVTEREAAERIRESFLAALSPMKKRLLICIQAVDMDDPLMGFFVTWLEEASRAFATITVLALRVGRYNVPDNVTVVPLRPNGGSSSRTAVAWRVLRESWLRRHAYDAVFVRGDPHYVLLAGWLWRLLGKRVLFWFAHWKVSRAAVLGYYVAHITVASVKAAFDHPRITPIFIGQNVDHRRFAAPQAPHEGPVRCLAFGSVRPVKRIELAIQSFLDAGGEAQGAKLTIVGPRTDAAYEVELRKCAVSHSSILWRDGVSYDQVPDLLKQFDLTINACVGSLDKVILETMMSGQIVIASTPGVKDWLPEHLQWLFAQSREEITAAVKRVFEMSADERWKLGLELRALAIEHHSLQGQIRKLVDLLG